MMKSYMRVNTINIEENSNNNIYNDYLNIIIISLKIIIITLKNKIVK